MIIREANIRRPSLWKQDSWTSVEYYNQWFMSFAPNAFKEARKNVLKKVLLTFEVTNNLLDISSERVFQTPQIIEVLRMVTAPPLAQDRLIGLSNGNKTLLKNLEAGKHIKNSE